MNRKPIAALLFSITFLSLISCAHLKPNPYESATTEQADRFKTVAIPFQNGTHFFISQGAFGTNSHNEPGNEYHWDFDVPFGTDVTSVEYGRVFQVYEPDNSEGGCDPKFSNIVHNVKILHGDGSIAQYAHVKSLVEVGQLVTKGQVIALTAKNGFICQPQLCFAVFRSQDHLYGTEHTETIPLRFEGVEGGLLKTGHIRK